MRASQRASGLAAMMAMLLGIATPAARAETGRVNIHLEPGVAIPVGGVVADLSSVGISGTLRADVALHRMFSLQLGYNYGLLLAPESSALRGRNVATHRIGGGARLRILDDTKGWLGEPGGSVHGNLWIDVNANFGMVGANPLRGFSLDAGVGYSLSLAKPLSLGIFARFSRDFVRADLDDGRELNGVNVLQLGLVASLSLGSLEKGTGGGTGGTSGDSDGDGLKDKKEVELGTDPTLPDSDDDGILDGVEHSTGTDPNLWDTDGDELSDGAEDKNRNGIKEAGESDPRKPDTDGGGVADGAEVRIGTDPLAPEDDDPELVLRSLGLSTGPEPADGDGDGVPDPGDVCPGTPADEEVDERGCIAMAEVEVLYGLAFVGKKKTSLDPTTLPILDRWVEVLKGLPAGERIEIAGHADDVAAKKKTLMRRSTLQAEAVKAYFVVKGIPGEMFVAIGYANTDPLNEEGTPEAAEENSRIELRRLGGGATAPPATPPTPAGEGAAGEAPAEGAAETPGDAGAGMMLAPDAMEPGDEEPASAPAKKKKKRKKKKGTKGTTE